MVGKRGTFHDDVDEMVPPLLRIFKFPVVANLQFQLFSPPPLSPVREYKEGNKRNGFLKNILQKTIQIQIQIQRRQQEKWFSQFFFRENNNPSVAFVTKKNHPASFIKSLKHLIFRNHTELFWEKKMFYTI